MRIGLDATPLLGARTGIGRYVQQLLEALTPGPDELVATAFTLRGGAVCGFHRASRCGRGPCLRAGCRRPGHARRSPGRAA
jgi:hypothetical protein